MGTANPAAGGDIHRPHGEDLLFYVRELTQELQIENCEIRLEGNPTKQDGRLLREYFKHVAICE